jgi:hypothetical protein
LAALRNQHAISGKIVVAEEIRLPPVSSLGDVMRKPRDDDPCQTCDDSMLSNSAPLVI